MFERNCSRLREMILSAFSGARATAIRRPLSARAVGKALPDPGKGSGSRS